MKRRIDGFAMAMVLVLLLGLCLLAIAGASGALAGLALAGYAERAELAFRAAEAGSSRALASLAGRPMDVPAWPAEWPAVTTRTTLQPDASGSPGGWAPGFSVGDRGFELRHYTIVATGHAGNGARAAIEQGFAVIATRREAAQ